MERFTINGYSLEKSQNWSGCVIDRSISMSNDKDVRWIIDYNQNIEKRLKVYKVPYKNPLNDNFDLVVNWTLSKVEAFSEEKIFSAFTKFNKTIKDNKEEELYQNTLNFFRYINCSLLSLESGVPS